MVRASSGLVRATPAAARPGSLSSKTALRSAKSARAMTRYQRASAAGAAWPGNRERRRNNDLQEHLFFKGGPTAACEPFSRSVLRPSLANCELGSGRKGR